MGLSDSAGRPVASVLLRKESRPRWGAAVRVQMLRDGHGITTHGSRPLEIWTKKGDVIDISVDLAENWGSATPPFCVDYVEPEETPPEVETVAEDEAPDETSHASPPASKKKRRRR